MSYTVEIKNHQRRLRLNPEAIKQLTAWILQKERNSEAEVSFLFLNDKRIQTLNRQYLGRDYPTDVLSFPQNEGKHRKLHPWFLGDVVVSTQRVVEQARLHNQSVEDEFCLCLIHGVLHLLGYRDDPARFRRLMREREEKLWEDWKSSRKWFLIKS